MDKRLIDVYRKQFKRTMDVNKFHDGIYFYSDKEFLKLFDDGLKPIEILQELAKKDKGS